MRQKLKIAIYSGDIPSTTFIERLIHGLAQKDLQIVLFGFIKSRCPKYNKSVSVIAYKNNKFHKALHLFKYSLLLALFRRKEKRKLDDILRMNKQEAYSYKVKYYPVLWHKPDIFHLQWAKGLSDWIWVKEFGIRFILSLRGAHINYSPIADESLANTYKAIFPNVDAFHAVSEAILEEATLYGAPRERIKVVYSGLEIATTNRTKTSSDHVFKMVSIGRSHWVKGYSYALDMCRILKDAGVDFKYTIIGGSNAIELSYQIHDLELQEHVELLDQMPFEEVKRYIVDSDLILLSSVKEGLANVVLEAMTLRTLVLATDCGGISEVITHGENGFLCSIRNPQNLADSVVEIIHLDPEEKKKILENAYNYVSNNHNQESMVSNMYALYNELNGTR